MPSIQELEARPWPLPQQIQAPRRKQRRSQPADPHAGKPHNWPFGALTEAQIRARNAFEARARQDMLAKLPEALL